MLKKLLVLAVIFAGMRSPSMAGKEPYSLPNVGSPQQLWKTDELPDEVNKVQVLSKDVILLSGKGTFTLDKSTGKPLQLEGLPDRLENIVPLSSQTVLLVGEDEGALVSPTTGKSLVEEVPDPPYTIIKEIATGVYLICGDQSILYDEKAKKATSPDKLPGGVAPDGLFTFAPHSVLISGDGHALISTETGEVVVSGKTDDVFASIVKEYKDPEDNPFLYHNKTKGVGVIYLPSNKSYAYYDLNAFKPIREFTTEEDNRVDEACALGDYMLFLFRGRNRTADWRVLRLSTGEKINEGKYSFGKVQAIINPDTFQKDGSLYLVCGDRKSPSVIASFDLDKGEFVKKLTLKGTNHKRVDYYKDGVALLRSGYWFLTSTDDFALVNVLENKVLLEGVEKIDWLSAINIGESIAARKIINSPPLNYFPQLKMMYQIPVGRYTIYEKDKQAPNARLAAPKARWFLYADQKAVTANVGGEGFIYEEFSIRPKGVLFSGYFARLDDKGEKPFPEQYMVGLLDFTTGAPVWKHTFPPESKPRLESAKGNVAVFSVQKNGPKLFALTVDEGAETKVPQAYVASVETKKGESYTAADVAQAILGFFQSLKKNTMTVDGREFGADTPIPGTDLKLVQGYNRLGCYDESAGKMLWQTEGIVEQLKFDAPERARALTFGTMLSPDIELLKVDGDVCYVIVTGTKERVFYTLNYKTGAILNYANGSAVLDGSGDVMYMFFDKKGRPGKRGAVRTVTNVGGVHKVTYVGGAGPVEGSVVKAFELSK
ncbi:MAG: hypothetical protein GF331_18720 [Chitinivibrionales bacterium]|nr:hypothetical protein [Chitinivibrionales bacterium]